MGDLPGPPPPPPAAVPSATTSAAVGPSVVPMLPLPLTATVQALSGSVEALTGAVAAVLDEVRSIKDEMQRTNELLTLQIDHQRQTLELLGMFSASRRGASAAAASTSPRGSPLDHVPLLSGASAHVSAWSVPTLPTAPLQLADAAVGEWTWSWENGWVLAPP